MLLVPTGREQIDGVNCFEAPSDLTLPVCQEMVCRFQVCLQRYLADPVIRGANISYKKPCMNVAQVCRSTLHRNRLLIFDKTTTPISLLCKWGNVWLDAGLCAQRCVQSFTPLEGQQHLCEATAKSKHQTRKTPRTRRKQEPLRSPGVQVKSCKLRTSSQSSKEPVAGDIEMEQVAFPKFSSATLNFHMRGKLSDMINEAGPNSLIQISPSDMGCLEFAGHP